MNKVLLGKARTEDLEFRPAPRERTVMAKAEAKQWLKAGFVPRAWRAEQKRKAESGKRKTA